MKFREDYFHIEWSHSPSTKALSAIHIQDRQKIRHLSLYSLNALGTFNPLLSAPERDLNPIRFHRLETVTINFLDTPNACMLVSGMTNDKVLEYLLAVGPRGAVSRRNHMGEVRSLDAMVWAWLMQRMLGAAANWLPPPTTLGDPVFYEVHWSNPMMLSNGVSFQPLLRTFPPWVSLKGYGWDGFSEAVAISSDWKNWPHRDFWFNSGSSEVSDGQ